MLRSLACVGRVLSPQHSMELLCKRLSEDRSAGWFVKVPVSRARQVLLEYGSRPHRLSRKPLALLVAEQSQLVLPWRRVERLLGILRGAGPRVCCLAPLHGRVEASPPEGHPKRSTMSGSAARAASNALTSSLGCDGRVVEFVCCTPFTTSAQLRLSSH